MSIMATICIVALSSLFSGCVEEGTGTLILKITDAPSDLDISKALVNISSVMVHNSTVGWYTIVDESQTFDLIALENVSDVLGEQELEAGIYTQIRLNIDRALVTIDDVEYDLMHSIKNRETC